MLHWQNGRHNGLTGYTVIFFKGVPLLVLIVKGVEVGEWLIKGAILGEGFSCHGVAACG